ncbi:Peptidase family M23 [Nannocystis exedens]|uniref:Peptidase family M23 n=1 Tax=Nannocystis exedens TaxID=54 RepID=A0A1I1WD84_9BACT|nr:M23 family metallopeptidase [Nannocystis exedens]PCC67624.1 metalloendopeptidase [Nannocystis exedens]SFD92959.1 Peptidase family M23 [Nannocystis exedens]
MTLSQRTSSLAALAVVLACGDAEEPAAPVEASTDAAAPAAAPEEPAPPDPFAAEGIEAARPGLRFGWPVESPHITSYFGWRTNPMTGVGTKLHRGLDLRGGIGDLILSIGPGVVAFAGQDLLLGNLVIVDHGLGVTSYYGHMHDILVHAGLPVDRGTALGLVGNTGRSEAPHLHLTVKIGALAVDPLWLIGAPLHGYPGLPALAEADTDVEY